MFRPIQRQIRHFFRKSRTINNEPLNKVSLIVIVLIDIFILVNVFSGLDDISRWHISPSQAYPCYSEQQAYQTSTANEKDFNAIRLALPYESNLQRNFRDTYQQVEADHLGKVFPICLAYADTKDQLDTPENQQIDQTISQKQGEINELERANAQIRSQYDSTLLE